MKAKHQTGQVCFRTYLGFHAGVRSLLANHGRVALVDFDRLLFHTASIVADLLLFRCEDSISVVT